VGVFGTLLQTLEREASVCEYYAKQVNQARQSTG